MHANTTLSAANPRRTGNLTATTVSKTLRSRFRRTILTQEIRLTYGEMVCDRWAALRAVSSAQNMHNEDPAHQGREHAWIEVLKDRLPLYGHRNWIVIADSAYPDQKPNGIETVIAHESQFAVLNTVLRFLSESRHVRPIIYTDQELPLVDESDAPGVSDYRDQLASILNGQTANVLPHEQIIGGELERRQQDLPRPDHQDDPDHPLHFSISPTGLRVLECRCREPSQS